MTMMVVEIVVHVAVVVVVVVVGNVTLFPSQQ